MVPEVLKNFTAHQSPKRILLYYPPNHRSVAIETICKTVKDAGHTILVLTLSPYGDIHKILKEMEIDSFTHTVNRKPSSLFFYKQSLFLIRFCRNKKIDTVWSHLQEANLIALLAAPFIKAGVFVFRHHDESSFYAQYGKLFGMARNRKEIYIDRFINRFAKKIVVLSAHVRNTMIQYEKCNPGKIIICPLIYDFSKYPVPDQAAVMEIRQRFNSTLLLIMVSRMIESKQHLVVFEVIKQLVSENLSIKLVVMDDGPLRKKLEDFVSENNLADYIFMPGFTPDIINYMKAADLLVHPSLTEASSNVVKEMGLLRKAVAVCEGVGDFDDYITGGENGYILEREDLKASIDKAIRFFYANPDTVTTFGENHYKKVLALFSNSKENKERYLQLI